MSVAAKLVGSLSIGIRSVAAVGGIVLEAVVVTSADVIAIEIVVPIKVVVVIDVDVAAAIPVAITPPVVGDAGAKNKSGAEG